jgi:hypothetical protein
MTVRTQLKVVIAGRNLSMNNHQDSVLVLEFTRWQTYELLLPLSV